MKEKFQKLFSLSPQGILVVRGEDILYVNEKACQLYGGSPAACKASSLFPEELIAPGTEARSTTVIAGDGTAAAVACALDADTVLIRLTPAAPFREPAAPPMLLSAMRDSLFSLRISAEQMFSRLQQGDQKIAAYSGVFFRSYFTMLRTITAADTANALRAGTLPFSPVNVEVSRLCADLMQTVSHLVGSGASLKCECAGPMIAMADPDALEQLLLNLISNSLLHTPAGGSITLSLTQDRGDLILAVDDEGSGLSDLTLAELFTGNAAPDFTDPSKGAGLGLEVAEGLAQLHGGSLVISGREGRGTSVRVRIPIRHSPTVRFSSAAAPYRAHAMDNVFRELATALDSSRFNEYFTRYKD